MIQIKHKNDSNRTQKWFKPNTKMVQMKQNGPNRTQKWSKQNTKIVKIEHKNG